MAISINNKDFSLGASPIKAPPRLIAAHWRDILSTFGRKIKPSELIFFTSQLSLMLEIGTPQSNALKAVAKQSENPAFKKVIRVMLKDIEEGKQLSDAMRQHPRVFNKVYTSMIKAGETGCFLKDILDRIVEMQEKRQALVTQLKTALTYPAFLCLVGVVVIVFVMVYVLPKFTAFFKGSENVLPLTTRFLMAASASLRGYWWIYILAGIGIATGIKLFLQSKKGQIFIDRVFLGVPFIANIANKIYTCELLRTLGHLMESQVPLLEALAVTRGTIGNHYFRSFVDQIMEHVEQGGRFSRPFASHPYILPSVKEMVATGEEAGNLSRVMLRLAQFYETEVERALKTLASMIEPIALIVMGGVIGLIVSSVILPIFKLAHTLH